MRLLSWLVKNSLYIAALFLLAFIPLYPKWPLFGVSHTWVYIRLEDFFVAISLIIWLIFVIRKKITLNTPLTIPIVIFWFIGAVATIYSIIYIFPHLANVFPNVAALYLLRHIEYLSVFFITFSVMRQKRDPKYLIFVTIFTLLVVCFYGFGQRGFLVGWEHRFPAYSTMNEEFAKGIPLLISASNRVQSTFAGHYDLAAYLVLLIPLAGSLIFSYKNYLIKIALFLTAVCALILLLMTASRVSFAVYLLTITFMLIIRKQKKFIIPVILFSIVLLNFFQGISQRLASTVSQVDLVVDARTGKPVGIAKTVTTGKNGKVTIVEKQSTGEQLSEGSGYINLAEDSNYQNSKVQQIVYKRTQLKSGKEFTEVTNIEGNFIIKKALAYDVSFTTRFQGEWPRAIEAFKKNFLFGTGYSSISLATDNNYLRILGETGLAGLFSFLFIFIIFGIYTYRILPDVNSAHARGFILGTVAGIFGLLLNAILIDVFEASKVAFVLWLVVGAATGLLYQYQKKKINYKQELISFFTSIPILAIYLFIASFAIFSIMFNNYFVADDFTWLRWVADCKKELFEGTRLICEPLKTTFIKYFTDASGFFYRPGAKLYYYYLYAFAWLNPVAYHVLSLFIHFTISVLVLIISNKILKSRLFAFLTAILFLLLSAHSETIFWISSTGHLIASLFMLLALLLHIYFREKKNILFLFGALSCVIIAPLFQEMGIMTAPLIILYDYFIIQPDKFIKLYKCWYYLLYALPIPIYFYIRVIAHAHWSGGDYSYNLTKLLFNIPGNLLGYIGLTIFGSNFIPVYSQIRLAARENTTILIVVFAILIALFFISYKYVFRKVKPEDKKIVLAFIILFIVPLAPVLALGNIALRYLYLATFGIILMFMFIFNKLYKLAHGRSKYAVLAIILILSVLYSLFNIKQLYNSNNDWKKAGEITDNLLVTLNYTFPVSRATPPNPVFYFVNTPVKLGEAWVFPVGLDDALWFTFQNENLTVHNMKNLNLALDAAEGSSSARVFEFNKSGNIEQVIRTKQ
jgi:hypothetical protein